MSLGNRLALSHLGRSRRRSRSLALRAAHPGLTMLEIMIVIAILGLVMGLVVVPRVMGMFGESKEKLAKLAVDKFANDDYGKWLLSNQEKGCPDDLGEIAKFTGKDPVEDTKDPWGTPYKFYCGADVPAGTQKGSIAVQSFGEDKQPDTADDIVSWKKLK